MTPKRPELQGLSKIEAGEAVRSFLLSLGSDLLSPWSDGKSTISLKCTQCSSPFNFTWRAYRQGQNPSLLCKHCHPKISIVDSTTVDAQLRGLGSRLIGEYSGFRSPITFACTEPGCSGTGQVVYSSFHKSGAILKCKDHLPYTKWNTQLVSEWFKSKESNLLSEFVATEQNLTFSCSECGTEVSNRNWNTIQRLDHAKCFNCSDAPDRLTLEVVRERFRRLGKVEIPDQEITSGRDYVAFHCSSCSGLGEYQPNRLLSLSPDSRALQCKSCREKDWGTFESVSQFIKDLGSTPLFTEYKNAMEPIPFTCVKCLTVISNRSWTKIRKAKQLICPSCYRAQNFGTNHPNWKAELTPEERANQGRHPIVKPWYGMVRSIYDNRCAISGEKCSKLSAHHLNAYSTHPELRFSLRNGIAIHSDLHDQYHRDTTLRRGTETAEDFYSYLTPTLKPWANTSLDDVLIIRYGDPHNQMVLGQNKIYVFPHELGAKITSYVRSKLGQYQTTIPARKTKAVALRQFPAADFLKDNHRQGSCLGVLAAYGLTYEGKLIAVATFGKPRFNKEAQWELLRFATLSATRIQGGASKLLSAFIKEHKPTSIVSYSDIRYNPDTERSMYPKLGFSLI